MRQGDILNGYRVLEDFSVAGGGQSKWSFAEYAGKEFFIKEFLQPTFPVEGSPGSPKLKEKKRKICQVFENHHRKLQRVISERCSEGGNLVYTIDFFRHGAKYYKITDKIDVSSLTEEQISLLPLGDRHLILKTIAHSLRILHQAKIVHGDLKPANILIKAVDRNYVAKLIDFDNSFFAQAPPEDPETLVGDMVFYSPELLEYITGREDFVLSDLSTSSDIFALGLVFTQYLTGQLPPFDRSQFNYACEAVSAGQILTLPEDKAPSELRILLEEMLGRDPASRPRINDVFRRLKSFSPTKPRTVEKTGPKPTLRGLGLKIADPSSRREPPRDSDPDSPATTDRSPGGEGPRKPKLRGTLLKKTT